MPPGRRSSRPRSATGSEPVAPLPAATPPTLSAGPTGSSTRRRSGWRNIPACRSPRTSCSRGSGSQTSSTSRSRPSCFAPRGPAAAAPCRAAAWRSSRPSAPSGCLPASSRTPSACSVTSRRCDGSKTRRSGNRKPVRTAIATVCLSGTLPEKLEAIAAAKFKGVEIFENDLLSFNGTPAEVRRMAADLGLEIITFQPFRDFEGMPEPHRGKALSRAERKVDVMADLGCDLLLVCSNVSPDALGGVDRAAADFRELGERAARRGLRVGYEALAWGRHVSDYRDAWEVVRRADHPSVGLILDSFHILARKTDLTPM